jgi:hypothetical protein
MREEAEASGDHPGRERRNVEADGTLSDEVSCPVLPEGQAFVFVGLERARFGLVGRLIIGGGLMGRGSTLEGSRGALRREGCVSEERSLSGPQAPAWRIFSLSFSSYCLTLLFVTHFVCPFLRSQMGET